MPLAGVAGPVPTVPLWIVEPRRATSISTVTSVCGPWFTLDRTLFAPTSRACRHPQPHDQGMVLLQGTKRRLVEVRRREDGDVWHRCRDWTPAVGDRLQCQLDADRRLEAARAHTALHLLLRALADVGGGTGSGNGAGAGAGARPGMGAVLRRDPEVKGGGMVRLDLAAPVAPAALAAARQRVLAWCAPGRAVAHESVLRSMQERVLDAQRFDPPDPYPGPPDVLPVVRVADVCAYPCDGTHVDRTDRITDVVFAEAKATRGGFLLVARVT